MTTRIGPRRARARGGFNLLHALVVLALAGALVYWLGSDRPLAQPPGILVPDAPRQEMLDEFIGPFERAGYTVIPVARFELAARVLGRARYRFDAGAGLSPVDLALGWGRMSDSAVLEHIDISQAGRWYRWRAAVEPIPRQEIVRSSANMHLIPADAGVEDALGAIRVGQVVELAGYLVEASHAASGHVWNSSLTRDDSGDGACELIWVERLRVR